MAERILTSTLYPGTPPTPDATSLRKGKLRLTGPLAGSADAPLVFGFASAEELEAWVIGLISEYGTGTPPTDPVTFMAPGFVAQGYVV